MPTIENPSPVRRRESSSPVRRRENQSPVRRRDYRLDAARGLCLFLILIDHTRNNALTHVTLGAFGLSDAATIFIFVSGYTAAIAFGSVYRRSGWLIGSARVGVRVWQLYVAQIAVVMAVGALPGLVRHFFGVDGYTDRLELAHLFVDPVSALSGIVTLTYVPPYLDILPVYVALMAMIPGAMAIARIDRRLIPALSLALWAVVRVTHWNLPADPSEGRGWFFDPFSWQLMFFAGFTLGMGWIRMPSFRVPALRVLAVAILVFGFIARTDFVAAAVPAVAPLHAWIIHTLDKTYLDPLEVMHFWALGYLATGLLASRLHLLEHRALRPILMVGQQSLSVFLATVLLADIGGIAFDFLGWGVWQQVIENIVAFAFLLGVARVTEWVKAAPWKRPGVPPAHIAAWDPADPPGQKPLPGFAGRRQDFA
jgi:hypothetical protein